ncbi:SDR family NAD(P)-dependent oxidoreductase [Acidipila sp. EB88]|uniref:SDR family NAD(P)-dependent oxidoreductase n=1 Tax=Acidipila sp. EB88 TaxID=2305226 RepID=UPI000F5F1BB4|nr:SDR family oxidoreductase [Acidipila sp. EB88]RRA49481.1 SDR family oxidoreductase [Acidipila sp. EB88]
MSLASTEPLILKSRPLQGRRVLVTGAAKRIGAGIARCLAEAGADIAITYHHSRADAEQLAEQLESLGVRTAAIACDLHEPAQITAAVAGAARALAGSGQERLDLLVNNAGAFETADLEHVSVAQWDAMFQTNTRAPLLVAQAALPFLRVEGGRILNIGSLGGLHPWATHGHYCASKAALHMLTQTMAKAWAPEVAVNCVAPGMIVTGAEAEEGYAHFLQKTPMQRNGRVGDVAEVVLYLASATMFLTGQIIAVDGGLGL